MSAVANETPWQGPWIWIKNASLPNTWAAFRHNFILQEKPAVAVLRVACSDKYWLWINGEIVVREGGLKSGPTPSDWYFDELDVSAWLKSGNNQIAILAWFFGNDGASHRNSGQGALLFQLETDSKTIVSSSDWKAVRHPAYGMRGGGLSVTLAEQAVDFDARLDMPGWTLSTFDDKEWSPAMEIGKPPCPPWGKLTKRPIPNWEDSGLRAYLTKPSLPISGPACVVGKLPANLQVYPSFRVQATAGLEITIQIDRDKKTTLYTTREGEQEFEVPAWGNGSQVAYTFPEGVQLLDLSYRQTSYASSIAGSFTSSEPALDLLWQKSAHTAHLCMRDTFMDCPDRERSPWPGDAANIFEVTLRALDRRSDALILKTFWELVDWASPEGHLWGAVPTSRFAGSFREFPAQTLSMIAFGLSAYWKATGDRELLTKLYPAIRRYLFQYKVEGGVVAHRGPWENDWKTGIQPWYDWGKEIDAELLDQTLYFAAISMFGEIAAVLDREEDAQHSQKLNKEIKEVFDSTYWCENAKAYRSKTHNSEPDERGQALAILTGLAHPSRIPFLVERLENGAQASIYMERHILEALAQTGEFQKALQRLKRRFAFTIAFPSSTLPEHFDEESNHAWGGAAVVLLVERLLGLTILEPGYRRVRFHPPRHGLAHANSVIPTIRGEIHLAFKFTDGGVQYNLSIPPSTIVEIPFPSDCTEISINGIAQSNPPSPLSLPSGQWTVKVNCNRT